MEQITQIEKLRNSLAMSNVFFRDILVAERKKKWLDKNYAYMTELETYIDANVSLLQETLKEE